MNTGYGYDVYFVFHAQLRAAELLVWSELIEKLRAALCVSTKAELCEVVRLPGTLNAGETHPVECEISEDLSSWTRYSVEEVRLAIDKSVAAVASHKYARRPSHDALADYGAYSAEALRRRGVPGDLLETIITGRVDGASGRGATGESRRDLRIASMLLRLGFFEEEIKSVFRAHPNGCGSNTARRRNGERYLEDLVRRAFTEGKLGDEWPEDDDEILMNVPPDYVLREGEIWYSPTPAETDRRQPKQVKVCNSFIRISEIRENIDTGVISLSIAFDYLGQKRRVPILRSEMADSRKLVAALSRAGAPVTSNNARLVTAYLAAYEHAFAADIPRKKLTSRFGGDYAAGPFFLPGLSSGVEFAPARAGDAALYRAYASRRGSLGGWLEMMCTLAADSLMIPQVAILASLVPPLQSRLQIPNFILDLYGNSSTGKSTTLKLAASVYGKPYDPDSLILQWMSTQVAVEQIAGLCSGLPIYLDDAQHCPGELKRSIIYMVANGRGKGRGSSGGGVSEIATWHTVALSTSEEPLHESSRHEGARGRLLPVGGFTPPFPPGQGSYIQSLEKAVAQHYGHAGEVYIRHLNGLTGADWAVWQRRHLAIRRELLGASSSDLVGRVSGYVAAIQLAAELAGPLFGLRFKPDVVGAWLMLHLGEQQSNQNLVLLALRALADYYVSNIKHFDGDGLYGSDKRGPIYGSSKKHQYVGFFRNSLERVFRGRGWSQSALLDKLAEAEALCTTEEDRHTKKVTVQGVKHRMVCVKWAALFSEDGGAGEYRF